MSWQAHIIGTDRERDLLKVVVKYFDETHEFTESIPIESTSGTDSMNEIVNTKLKELNSLDDLEATVLQKSIIGKTFERNTEADALTEVQPIDITPLTPPVEEGAINDSPSL